MLAMNFRLSTLFTFLIIFLLLSSNGYSSTENNPASIKCELLSTSQRAELIDSFKQSELNTDRQPSTAKRKQLAMRLHQEVEPYMACVRLEPDSKSKFKLANTLVGKLDAYTRFIYLAEIASISLEVDKNKEASMYASESLRLAQAYRQDLYYGDAIHSSNIVLGHVAFNHGKISEARQFLLQASKTPGSEKLSVDGPDTALARKLAIAGETETVIEYLRACKDFWANDNGQIDQWIASLQSQKLPF